MVSAIEAVSGIGALRSSLNAQLGLVDSVDWFEVRGPKAALLLFARPRRSRKPREKSASARKSVRSL